MYVYVYVYMQVMNEKEGVPITAIREIKFLKMCDHKNVVRLKEVIASKKELRENPTTKKVSGCCVEICMLSVCV